METQPVLFEVEKQIPQWLADYFNKANAGAYPYKQSFYNNVKPVVLKSFGRFSGYDLQIIQQGCRSCNGTGKYKHYYYEDGYRYILREEPCWHCTNGIYMTRKIMLSRHILNGVIYHIPCPEIAIASDLILKTIKGIIVHKPVNPKEAMRAYIILLWKYNKPVFYNHIKSLSSLKIKWLKDLLTSIFKKDNTSDELPF